MKKKLVLTLATLVCLAGLVGCKDKKPTTSSSEQQSSSEQISSETTVHVTSVAVSPKKSTLYIDGETLTLQLSAVVLPENAANKDVTWDSLNKDIATVDANGLVTAVGTGKATIVATSVDGNLQGEATVTVKYKSQDSTIDELNKPKFYADYEKNTNSLDKVANIQTNNNPSKTSYYENEQGTRDYYKVGNQNEFKALVTGKVTDERGRDEIINNPSVKVSVELYEDGQYVAISDSDLANHVAINKAEGKYQFTTAAAGNRYKLTVSPDETMYSDISEYCSDVVMEIEVINGYNVYTKEELSLFDNQQASAWSEIRTAAGIENVKANGIALHSNITITNDDVPASFKYSEARINQYLEEYPEDFSKWCTKKGIDSAEGKALLTDSLIDVTTLYQRLTAPTDPEFRFEGNYFNIDTQQVKQVYAFWSSIKNGTVNTEYVPDDPLKGCDGSHAQLFGINDSDDFESIETGSKVTFKNVTIFGNGDRSDDDKYLGGLITLKLRSVDFLAQNVITSKSFVTFMPMVNKNSHKTVMHLDRCKNFDSYNSLLYVWGTEDNLITNSFMVGAGGAIALLDEVNAHNTSASTHGTPKVDCYNCFFENPLTGLEPWFVNHKASALVQMMQAFGANDAWIGRNAKDHGEHMNIITTDGTTNYIDLIAIDICGHAPLSVDLADGGMMLTGHFNIYNDPEMTEIVTGLDMSKLAVANPALGQEAFVGAALQAYQQGNPLPLYKVMAASAGSQGIFVQTASGHGMLSDAAFKNGVIAVINDPVAPAGSTPVAEGIAITPIPFYADSTGSGAEVASNIGYAANMNGLASGEYMSMYLQASASTEYLGAFLKLHKIA